MFNDVKINFRLVVLVLLLGFDDVRSCDENPSQIMGDFDLLRMTSERYGS